MYFLMILITIFLLIILLAAIFPLRAALSFNSEIQPDFHLLITWLHPLIKAYIVRSDGGILLTVHSFNKKIYTKNLKEGKGGIKDKLNIIKIIKPKHLKLQASYGFEDPSITGLMCGALDMISEFADVEVSHHNPDFSMDSSYANLTAEADINLLKAMLKLQQNRKLKNTMRPLHGHK
jgi:hypothetical protein